MSNVWTVLGLNGPVDDVKTVKRAYAAKLKTTRPDDDPDGFITLRAARDHAIEHCRYSADFIVDAPSETLKEPLYPRPSHDRDAKSLDQSEKNQKGDILLYLPQDDRLMDDASKEKSTDDLSDIPPITLPAPASQDYETAILKVKSLLRDPFRRQNPAHWEAIFDQSNFDSIDTVIIFETQFLYLLLEFFGIAPKDKMLNNQNRYPRIISSAIGKLIFANMSWAHGGFNTMGVHASHIAKLSDDLGVFIIEPARHEPKRKMTIFERAEDIFDTWLFAVVILALGALSMGIGKFFAG